jgi:hypothetical protein
MPTAKTAAETAISETLRRQGFRIVEHGPEVQAMAVQRTAGAAEIALGDAVDLGRTLRADVVVIGRSVAESANYVGADAQSFRGSLIVRAYLTGTGEAMGSIVKTAVSAVTDPGAGSREALMHVGSQSAGELAALIASAWQEQGPGGNQFEIQLSGTRNLVNFVQFRRALTTVAGVERVQVRELRADDAAIGVSYRGETTELADAIKLQAFETFGVSITDVAPERLKVKLIPRIARTTVQ